MNGKLTMINNSLNTYTIKSDDGITVMLRVGIGSDRLLCDGIRVCSIVGTTLSKNDPLCIIDLKAFLNNGISPIISILLLNSDDYDSITVFEGDCKAGHTEVMSFKASKQLERS